MIAFLVASLLVIGSAELSMAQSSVSIDVQVIAQLDLTLSTLLSEQATPLLQVVPPPLQEKLPEAVKQALSAETVIDLKAELKAVKEVLIKVLSGGGTAGSLSELFEQLKQAAPETTKLLQAMLEVLKQKYQEFKAALAPQALEFIVKLEALLSQKTITIQAQLEVNYKALDLKSKESLNAMVC